MLGKNHLFITGWLILASAAVAAVAVCWYVPTRGSSDEALVGRPTAPIRITAEWMQEWSEEQGTIALLRGLCRIEQGTSSYSADSMVIWAHKSEESGDKVDHLTVYFEGDVKIDDGVNSRTDRSYWLELDAARGINLSVRGRTTDRSGTDDPLFKRAVHVRSEPIRTKIRQTQLTVPANTDIDPGWRPMAMQGTGNFPFRHIRVSPRSFGSPFSITTQLSDDTNPPEQVTLITGGVNIVIEGLTPAPGQDFGIVDLSADRALIWTDNFSPDQQQSPDQKYQIYMEGHIVIRQRDNVRQAENTIRANQAYYDARDHRALVLAAELETYVPQIGSSIRMSAERIRQNSDKNYHAQNAWITTSQMGIPGYRFQAEDIFLENREEGLFGNVAPPRVDPQTGVPVREDHSWVTALNTRFMIDQFPIFNIPRVSAPTDAINGSSPLQNASVGFDRVFGTHVRTTWDVFSLFNLDRPQNPQVKLGLKLDYLSYRGPSVGLFGNYTGTDASGNLYSGSGIGQYWSDAGTDNLGFGRRALIPATNNRGFFDWENRYQFNDLAGDLRTEISDISDRNVEEQFDESRFDRAKDFETKALWSQQLWNDSSAYSILGRTQLNSIENNTQWLPRGDLFVLGEPLVNSLFNYSSHSSLGYGVMNGASAPTDPTEVFTPLPYMKNAEGLVTQTRHELEAPFNLGPFKFAPFVLGEAAYWGDSISGGPISRLYGRAGVRSSISFERIFPDVHSDIFNVNGLAHKSFIEAEYGISGSNQNLNNILQWNEIDDNAQERFRMRLVQNTYGGVLPVQADPRFYAVRSLAGTSVTAPYGELVADQQVLRLDWHHRLQTKVGPPDLQRVKDWMTLDVGASIFPNANRDNFGQTVGLFSSRYMWNVGDRTSLVASSMYDFFPQGQQLWSVGIMSQRSLRGSVYVGLRQVKLGPLDSQILTATYSYVLSPKWISTATTAYDLGQSRSAGQGFTITRVGEWMLIHLGGNVDVSKNNVGFGITMEPRLGKMFVSSTQLGSLLGSAPGRY